MWHLKLRHFNQPTSSGSGAIHLSISAATGLAVAYWNKFSLATTGIESLFWLAAVGGVI